MFQKFYTVSIAVAALTISGIGHTTEPQQTDLGCFDFSTLISVKFISNQSMSGELIRHVVVAGMPDTREFTAVCVMNSTSQEFEIPDLARCNKIQLVAGEDPAIIALFPIDIRLVRNIGEIKVTIAPTGIDPFEFSCGERINPWAPRPQVRPPVPEEPIQFTQILPILRNRCAICHSGSPMGPPHSQINFVDRETVVRMKQAISERVLQGSMPRSNPEFRFSPDGQLLLQWLLYDGILD